MSFINLSSTTTASPSQSSSSESIFSSIALGAVIGAVTILASGIISRYKSELSKVETSMKDCESTIRYILLPCACLVYFATAHPRYLYGGFLLDRENFVPLFFLTFVEPLGSALFQKFYLNEQKEEEVSGFTLFLTRLRLCSQSLAFPLGVTLGMKMMFNQEDFNTRFGIDFDSTKMLIVFVYTFRGAFQRFGCRYVALRETDRSNENKQKQHWFANVNYYFGDQFPAIAAIILGFIFNGITNEWSKTTRSTAGNSQAGIVGFVVGVCDTLANAFIPYCCAAEGFQMISGVWTIDLDEAQEEEENKKQVHKVDSVSKFTIPLALFALRLLAAIILSLFTAKDAGRDAILTIVLCALSSAVPCPTELKMIFDSEKDRFVLKRICLKNFLLSVVLIPVVVHRLIMM